MTYSKMAYIINKNALKWRFVFSLYGLTVTFFGHKDTIASSELCQKMNKTFEKFFCSAKRNKEKLTFLCGGYGNFDAIASSTIDKLRIEYPIVDCEKIYVTPYIGSRLDERFIKLQYDSIIYPPIENAPLKFAIIYRNQWMVDRAHYIIIHITHSWGGTSRMNTYAKKRNKQIIYV